MRKVLMSVTAAIFAAGLMSTSSSPAQAHYRRGDAVAFGVAAAIIGGIVANEIYRRKYRKRHYVAYHQPAYAYRPAYYGAPGYYYRPTRYYSYRHAYPRYRRHIFGLH